MEHKTVKQQISSSSSCAASSEINESLKFMDLSFADNSDSSTHQPDLHILDQQKQMTKSVPNKILPNVLYQLSEEKIEKDDTSKQEKTLAELNFKPNKIEGWENINQPHKQNLYDLLKNMIDNNIKPNVKIRVGDTTFNCHMMVLQCYSDFFMECSNDILTVQLPIEKITPQAFMMVYDWMLSAEPLVQREGILELFNAANFLKIKGLVDQCWVCLDDDIRFQEDTAFLLYLEARDYGLETLQDLMLTRICKFFLTLVASKDFLLLSAKEVCTLLVSNSIGVNSEVEILMSAVRWLSYDWKERQTHMLDVLNCVRFGLMPPWILVALGRDVDCEDVQRVIDNAKVKKMIEDGLSYTTTQLYYSQNVDNFVAFMERYKLTKPVQRQWICDHECAFHHKTDCPNRLYITYKSFNEYLEMIRSKGKDHWKTLHMEHQEGPNFQCCLPKAHASIDQYFQCVLPKESRDQGIQASGNNSDSDDTCGQTKPNAMPRTLDVKTSWYREVHSSEILNEKGFKHVPKTKTKTKTISSTKKPFPTKETNPEMPLEQTSSIHFDSYKKPTNIKKKVLAKSYFYSVSSEQEFGCTSDFASKNLQRTLKGTQISDKTSKTPLKDDLSCATSTTSFGLQRPAIAKALTPRVELNLSELSSHKVFLFGGIDPYAPRNLSNDEGSDVLYFDGCENSWSFLTNMPGSRHHHSAVVYGEMIYVIGGTRPPLAGSTKSIFESAVWKFNPKRLEWHSESTLPQPRRDFGLVAYDGNNYTIKSGAGQVDKKRLIRKGLFVIGGESVDGTPLSSTLFFDVETKLWSEEASLNIGRYGLAATLVNNKNRSEIWVAGGVCGQEKDLIPVITNSLETYDLRDDGRCWKASVTPLRIPRLFAKFCMTKESPYLYIVGGIGLDAQQPGEFKSLACIDRFDFEEQGWSFLTDMKMPRHGHDVVTIQDKILIIGGVSGSEKKTLTSVECFSTKTGSWLYNIALLPLPLSGLAAVVIDFELVA